MSRYASQLIIEKEKEKNLIDLGLEPESSDLAGQPTTARLQRQCYQYLVFFKDFKGYCKSDMLLFFVVFFVVFFWFSFLFLTEF